MMINTVNFWLNCVHLILDSKENKTKTKNTRKLVLDGIQICFFWTPEAPLSLHANPHSIFLVKLVNDFSKK